MDEFGNEFGSWDIEPVEPVLPVPPAEIPILGDFNVEGPGRLVEQWEVPDTDATLFQQIRYDENQDGHEPVGPHLNIESGIEKTGPRGGRDIFENAHIPLGYEENEGLTDPDFLYNEDFEM